jgi:hypothetical protein
MAIEPNENQDVPGQDDLGQQTQNEPQIESVDDSDLDAPGDPSASDAGLDRRTEERLRRLEERNTYLEKTQQILDEFNSRQPRQQQQVQEQPLPDDVAQLDRLLEPAVTRRFRQGMEPIIGTVSELKEDNDALRFDNFLNRVDPDVYEDEAKLNATYQQVEQFRRQMANERGQWVSRQDAYMYLDGLSRAKERMAGRKQRQQETVNAERKRITQARTTSTLGGSPTVQRGSTHQALIQKLRSNQRMSQEELKQLRDGPLSDQEF